MRALCVWYIVQAPLLGTQKEPPGPWSNYSETKYKWRNLAPSQLTAICRWCQMVERGSRTLIQDHTCTSLWDRKCSVSLKAVNFFFFAQGYRGKFIAFLFLLSRWEPSHQLCYRAHPWSASLDSGKNQTILLKYVLINSWGGNKWTK